MGHGTNGGRQAGLAIHPRAEQPFTKFAFLTTRQSNCAAGVVSRSLDEGQCLQHRVVQMRCHRFALFEADPLPAFFSDGLRGARKPRAEQDRHADDGDCRCEHASTEATRHVVTNAHSNKSHRDEGGSESDSNSRVST